MKKLHLFVFGHSFVEGGAALFSKIIALFVITNIIGQLPDLFLLYTKNGVFDEVFFKHVIHDNSFIIINNVTDKIQNFGIPYQYAFICIFLIYTISLMMIVFGYWKLLFSIISVVIHTIIINSSDMISYGADYMISFLLYINVFFCSEEHFSRFNYQKVFSFAIRLMQIQLCMIYFFGGFGKILGYDWFTGDAIWLALNHYMNTNALNYVSKYTPKYLYQILSIHTLLIELLYPIFIFWKRSKKWIMTDILLLHLGISLLIGLHTFSFAMIIFNIIAFYPKKLVELTNHYQRKVFSKQLSAVEI